MWQRPFDPNNWGFPPHNRASFQNVQALFPTARLRRGGGPVIPFARAFRELSGVTFVGPDGNTQTVSEMLNTTYTDAWVVLKDGTIVAADATLRFSGGPYYGMWAELGAMTAFACYDLKNVRTVGYEVLVNRPKTAAYRAPSAPMAAFAVESVVDELAHKIGMNEVDFRIKNAAKQGTRASYGPVYGPIGIGATLEAAKKHPHMKAPLGKNQGRGMACGFWFMRRYGG